MNTNKKKTINDPVHGFIRLSSELIYDIVNHPVFQRLRRIKQLGLTDFVYPGALHTRFHHALGAMHLMHKALTSLRSKGCEISDEEYEAALIAILLHDIGHGPFSHALEHSILEGVHHEKLSLLIMEMLNEEFDGRLSLSIKIFTDEYERRFFHQLVSSQLDVDRLDYLQRDSFFTGVFEGKIGGERIIKMLRVHHDNIVVDAKGIYSIEHFLNARRMMYWLVYLHKTTVSTEQMLTQVIRRAGQLVRNGTRLFATPALMTFLEKEIKQQDLEADREKLRLFTELDDHDIWASVKVWSEHYDPVLSKLSRMILSRDTFRGELENKPHDSAYVNVISRRVKTALRLDDEHLPYFVCTGSISNSAYLSGGKRINILYKNGELTDIAQASDLPNIKALGQIVRKYYLCYPKY